jgi:transcription antitermination protein NusB
MGRESEVRQMSRERRAARKVLAQALYQLQVGGQVWQDIYHQYALDPESKGADMEYLRELLMNIAQQRDPLDALLARYSDIEPKHLDPLEHGLLWLALYELQHRLDVPFRVAISEAVDLAKRFGATDGYKFVNGVLDRAAVDLRPHERDA